MRNDTHKWPAPPIDPRPMVSRNGVTLRDVSVDGQTIISGPRAAALGFAQLAETSAWPDVAQGDRYAVSLRRDRILLIGAVPAQVGWVEGHGVAVSDMSSGYAIAEIEGANAFAVLRTGTEISLREPSASALRLWHGYGVIVYRHGHDDRFRIHVGSAHFEGLWDMIQRQMNLIP